MPGLPLGSPERRSQLADLKDRLEQGLTWNANLAPTFTELPQSHPTPRGVRGYLGEEQLVRTASARGEIILDGPLGVEVWNQPGPDLVTLAEDDEGLVIMLYDNKAHTSRKNVSSVNSLDKHFAKSLAKYSAEWTNLSLDPNRGPAEQELFAKAASLANNGAFRRVVTNSFGRIEGITDRLANSGIEFEDLAGNLAVRDLPSAFAPEESPQGQQAATEAVDLNQVPSAFAPEEPAQAQQGAAEAIDLTGTPSAFAPEAPAQVQRAAAETIDVSFSASGSPPVESLEPEIPKSYPQRPGPR